MSLFSLMLLLERESFCLLAPPALIHSKTRFMPPVRKRLRAATKVDQTDEAAEVQYTCLHQWKDATSPFSTEWVNPVENGSVY